MSQPSDSPQESPPVQSDVTANSDDPRLESIRSILFASEQSRIQALEDATKLLSQQAQTELSTLQTQIDNLQAELDSVRQDAQAQGERADRLQSELDQLGQQIQDESLALFPRLAAGLSGVISQAIQMSREAMADALGPVMGEAIRIQIRDSREEMVEALYPVILTTVQRAIAEFARELQRNIDARLKGTFGTQGALRSFWARLRGVSQSELILRDSLPFEILELFLIQPWSGLLVAHTHSEDGDGAEADDSDLIGGMLTAIRDFTRDSFGAGVDDEELDEIQYGDQRIIIQSGRYVYIAAVITGIEPEGFRARLRQYVADLHAQYNPQLRDYEGDLATLPPLAASLAGLEGEFASPETVAPQPLSRNQRLALLGGGLAGIMAMACVCFYLQFTVALLPLAFGETPTSSPTMTLSPTEITMPTMTSTMTPTDTPAAIFTPSPTPLPPTITPTATALPTKTPTPEPLDTPIPTATTRPSLTLGPVWARQAPSLTAPTIEAIPAATEVKVLSQSGLWIEVEWNSATGPQLGWIPLLWVDLGEPIPDAIITPGPAG